MAAPISATSPARRFAEPVTQRPFPADRRLPELARGRCDPDLRADAAHRASRARPGLCREHRRGDRAASAAAASWSCWNRPPIPAPRATWCKPILERGGLKSRPRFLPRLFSPEREDPGNANFSTRDDPQGGRRRRHGCAGARRRALQHRSCRAPCRCRSPETAEAVKLTENIFRAVNIALVNELKMVFDGDGHRRLGGDRRGQDQAVRLHAVLSRAPGWAATASRSIRST